ncbi:MAG: nucleoside recognition domain-containing protein [Deltaproteobacteria bacterium]|nr:nucleoside recognition domain-containing protein [Deltaproteobacteria bacterium]
MEAHLKNRKPKTENRKPVLMAVVLAGVAAFLVYEVLTVPGLTPQKLSRGLGLPLLRLLFYMGVGLLIGQVIESLNWSARLGVWAGPVLRWGRLKTECGAAFTAAFFSGILANTMLMTFYQEGKLSRREMTCTYLLNNGLPVYLLHLPTTFFIILPLTRQAGLIYLGLGLAAALLRSAALLVYTHLRFPAAPGRSAAVDPAPAPARKPGGLGELWPRFRTRFSRVVLYTIPIYLLIFLLTEKGLFMWLREAMARWVTWRFLPVEAASVVIFSVAAEFTSGMAAAGALMDAGALTVPQTVVALMLGSMVATPVRALRHQLPSHAGIFSPALGMELLIMSQTLRIASLIAVVIPYWAWGRDWFF